MDEIEIEGCTIKVRIEGQDTAPVLVLSHMLGTDLSLWDGLVPELARHFRVVRYDARGHGDSGLGDTPVTIARLGRDVVAILDALEIERAHFCGLSMGGAVGLWLLAHAPARIERAVIAGSAAKLGEPAIWNARIAAALSDGMDQAVEPTIERWFSPAFVGLDPESVERTRTLLRATSPAGYAACCAALRDMDLREAVRGVTQPVLVLRGADDPSATADGVERLVEVMADATAVEIEARHCVAIEAAPAFTDAIVKFLTAARRAAGRAPARKAASMRAETSAARTKPSARRTGKRGVVAARQPVARTAPVSGKAVGKASANRKTAARAPSHRRGAVEVPRAAAPKTAIRKATSPEAASAKSAGKALKTKAPAAKVVQVASARRATATTRTASVRGKPPTAAALRAAAKPKSAVAPGKKASIKASSSTSPAKGRPAKAAEAKSGAAKSGPAKSAAAKPVVAQAKTKTKAASAKTAPAKTATAKSTPAKTLPTPKKATKPAASRRAAAPVAKPRRSSGRGKP